MKRNYQIISATIALLSFQSTIASTHVTTHIEKYSQPTHEQETPSHTTVETTTTIHTSDPSKNNLNEPKRKETSSTVSTKQMNTHTDKNIDRTNKTDIHKNTDETDKTKTNSQTEKKLGETDKTEKPLPVSTADMNASIAKLFAKKDNPSSLDKKQIYDLAKDPNITGQESATLAAMILAINNANHPNKVTFTQAELQAALNNPKTALYYYYTLAMSNINGIRALPAKQKLFGPGGISYNTQIIQNSDDDCYFLSAINSLMQTQDGPKALEKMITPVSGKDNEFEVNFPGDSQPVKVILTDTEIGMYSHLSNGGQWLAVLSVAEAKRRDQSNFDPEKTIQPGYQTQTYRLITNKKYTLYNIPATLNAKDTTWIADQITTALNNNLPIGIETNVHDLSIIGYENGNVIIKNPWGTSGWYNPVTAGSSNSTTMPKSSGPWYMMENGVFSVPIANIPNGFTQIAYHPGEPLNVTANFTPRLPVPNMNNVPSFTFTPSPVVAPVTFDVTSPTLGMDEVAKKKKQENNGEENNSLLIRCNYTGNNHQGCTGN